jgi:hypothetical protein
MTDIGDHEIVLAKYLFKLQLHQNPENADFMTTLEVRMDRESFRSSAPLQSQERMIRTILRTHYQRTDSPYTLKMGVCLFTQRPIENGSNKVEAVTTLLGGAPDPPEGTLRTKYRLGDAEECGIFAPKDKTIQEVMELIRTRHK